MNWQKCQVANQGVGTILSHTPKFDDFQGLVTFFNINPDSIHHIVDYLDTLFSQLYRMFPKMFHTLCGKSLVLSWSHYRELIRVPSDSARVWYHEQAVSKAGASEPSAGTSPPSTTTGSPGTRRWMTTAGTHLNRMQRVRPRDSPSSRTRSSWSSSTTCRASCSNSEGGSRSWPGRSTSGPRPKTSTSTWCSTTSTPGASCS